MDKDLVYSIEYLIKAAYSNVTIKMLLHLINLIKRKVHVINII